MMFGPNLAEKTAAGASTPLSRYFSSNPCEPGCKCRSLAPHARPSARMASTTCVAYCGSAGSKPDSSRPRVNEFGSVPADSCREKLLFRPSTEHIIPPISPSPYNNTKLIYKIQSMSLYGRSNGLRWLGDGLFSRQACPPAIEPQITNVVKPTGCNPWAWLDFHSKLRHFSDS